MEKYKYSLKDIAIKFEFYSKNKKPHIKFINSLLKESNIKYELIETKKGTGNTFLKAFYSENALNYIEKKIKGRNIKKGTNKIVFENLTYILIYGKNSKYKADEINKTDKNNKKLVKFILYSPCQHIPDYPDVFYNGGFYRVNYELYPQVSKIKKTAKKYLSRKRAENAQNIILKNTGQIFNIMEV